MDTISQRQLPFSHLVELIDRHVLELFQTDPAHGSDVWYLLSHLRKLQGNAHSSTSAKEVTQSVKILGRFAVDSLDFDGNLMKRVDEIYALHAVLLKA